MKAEDINSYDITPSWERGEPEPIPHAQPDPYFCQCGLCRLAAGGHL